MHVKIQLMLDGQVAAEIDLNEGERVVGSAEPSKILIEDPSVSPTHAKIYQSDGSLFIADLGSATGTMVDGRKIAEPTTLRDGQSVRIGEFELQIKVLPEEIAAAAASPSSPQPAPMEETPGDDRASAMSTAKSAAAGIGKGLLGMAGASAKEAGRGARLASLKAQIEKLRRTDLRRAYAALGAKARASGLAQQACPELTAEIQALDDELAEKRKGSDAGGDAGLMAKAKAKALGAKLWAEAEMLERKINGILAAIGEKLAGNPPEDAAFSAELRDIADIGLKIKALQDQFDAAYADGSARAAFAESAGSVHREASVAASAIPSGDVGPGDGKRSKLALAGLAMGLLSVPLLFVKPLALLLAAGALIAGCLGWFMARKSGGPRFGGKLNATAVALGVIVIACVFIFGGKGSSYSPIALGFWSGEASIPQGINGVEWGATPAQLQSKTTAISKSGTLGQPIYPLGWSVEYAICLAIGANETVFGTINTLSGAYMPQCQRFIRTRPKQEGNPYGAKQSTGKEDGTPYDRTVFLFSPSDEFVGYYSIVNANNEDALLADLNDSYGTKASPVDGISTDYRFPTGSTQPFYVEGWKWEDSDSVAFLLRYTSSESSYYLGLFKLSRQFVESVDQIRNEWIKGIRNTEDRNRERIKTKADGDYQKEQGLY